jgi:hypothetical protein
MDDQSAKKYLLAEPHYLLAEPDYLLAIPPASARGLRLLRDAIRDVVAGEQPYIFDLYIRMFDLHLGMSRLERVFFDELLERISVLERILIDKAALERAEAAGAALGFDPAATEKGAKWLRTELRRLRDAQEIGRHPSRRGTTLSLLEISDAAFTMVRVQNCLGEELLSLLLELLNLHRQSPRDTHGYQFDFDMAALADAQLSLLGERRRPGVREMARYCSVSVSTASEWMRSTEYKEKAAAFKKFIMEDVGDYVEMIKVKFPDITDGHAFDIAFGVRSTLRLPETRYSEHQIEEMRDEFEALRSHLKQPPIQINFLPTEKFSVTSLEELEHTRTMVLNEITKLIGDPAGKVDRLSGVFGKFLFDEH